MKFLLATKEYMTQVFDANGRVHPATVLSATPNTVTQVKTAEKDGYSAVQVGFGTKKEKHVKKPQATKGAFAHFAEYRPDDGTRQQTSSRAQSFLSTKLLQSETKLSFQASARQKVSRVS